MQTFIITLELGKGKSMVDLNSGEVENDIDGCLVYCREHTRTVSKSYCQASSTLGEGQGLLRSVGTGALCT